MWFNRSKSSLQALPIFSLVMSISQQIHNYPHKFPSIFRGGSDTLISNDEWLWMVARRPSTTKRKVIIQTNIWYHWYYILATLSVMFACHPIWRGHPPSRDPWRHVKTHYNSWTSDGEFCTSDGEYCIRFLLNYSLRGQSVKPPYLKPINLLYLALNEPIAIPKHSPNLPKS